MKKLYAPKSKNIVEGSVLCIKIKNKRNLCYGDDTASQNCTDILPLGIPLEEYKYHWEPSDMILRGWIYIDGNARCKYCDFSFPEDVLPPIKQEMKYSERDYFGSMIGNLVDIDPGLDYYKKRYEIGMIKQNHWDKCHPVKLGWAKDWKDNGRCMRCMKCGYPAYYDLDTVSDSSKYTILDKTKKMHRRVCSDRIKYS